MSEEQNKNREKREFERGNNFDVFVSYRRSDGKSFARTLNLAFKNEGFRCFLDYDKLEGGDFSKQLQDAVVDAPVFVMVMTPDYFARCVKKVETADGKTVFEPDEDDWVRREIDLALSNGKIIIPIDVNGMLNGTPDYLDKDFGNRVGCHQFSPVYDNNAFEATFDAMLNKNIWNRFSKLEKPTDKAMVTVATDADCKLMKNNKLLATLQADEHSPILLGRGNHLLQARSEEFPQISVNVIKKIEDVSCDDFIIIELKDKLQPLREEKKKEEKKAKRLEWFKQSLLNPTKELETFEGHLANVNSVNFSADGKYLASGSDDGTIIIWDANNGEKLKILEGESWSICSVCWSPYVKYLASGSSDEIIVIWDANSGQKIKTLEGHSHIVNSVCWSPDGNYLASGSWDNTVKLWNAKSGECIQTLEGHSFFVYSVAWSPDGNYLASGSWDNTVKIWDAKSGVCMLTFEEHSDDVNSVSWSPDGKYLASGAEDNTVKIWGVE